MKSNAPGIDPGGTGVGVGVGVGTGVGVGWFTTTTVGAVGMQDVHTLSHPVVATMATVAMSRVNESDFRITIAVPP